MNYRVRADALELRYRIDDDGPNGDWITIAVPIVRSRCRYGGERPYWQCPNCGRRCEVIAIASHGRFWGCRGCLRLRYHSQGLAPADRVERRAAQLCERAGVEDQEGTVHKHKWMRWRTYNRLMERAGDLNAVADWGFASRIARLFGNKN